MLKLVLFYTIQCCQRGQFCWARCRDSVPHAGMRPSSPPSCLANQYDPGVNSSPSHSTSSGVFWSASWLRDPLFWCYNWSSFTPPSVANKDPPNPLRRMALISSPLNSCMDVGTNLKLWIQQRAWPSCPPDRLHSALLLGELGVLGLDAGPAHTG